MWSAVLAFVGAIVYGSADFLGGLAARRLRATMVTAVAAVSGAVLLGVLTPVLDGSPTGTDVLWGAASGAAGAIAIGLLYGCLAIGPMSVLSPVTAVVSAIAPMLWGVLVSGERLGALAVAGLAVALVAIVLVALLPGERIVRPSPRALLMATGSGLAIGAFLILLDQTGDDSGLLPLVTSRVVNAAITGGIAAGFVIAAVRSGRSARSAVLVGGARG
ncbi:EamA family transporter, partial [Microbacterium sp.]|uniref:EamA family transporter n=1 Tax=Microbacterium sp. TaxID=51671 RepID=UPI003C71B9CF